MKQVSVIIVNYNTPEIITRAVNSIDKHVNEVIIIDSSDRDNPAFDECDVLTERDNVKVFHTLENIGHGPGLNLGIDLAANDTIIVMDSDAVLKDETLISEMYEMMARHNVYGAGLVVNVNDGGATDANGKYPYLHPYFAMISRYEFNQWPRFVNHGAPWLRTAKALTGKMNLVNVPNIRERAWHEHRRTRVIAKGWNKNWEKA